MNFKKWDYRFLQLAQLVAGWSKDPSTQVGAVIVDDDYRIVSVGYNGFPKKIVDNFRLNDRKIKYDIVVHAEANALLFANKPVDGCTIYTWPFEPCPRCAGLIIQAGIKRVVSFQNKNTRWEEDFKLSRNLFCEAGVILQTYNV